MRFNEAEIRGEQPYIWIYPNTSEQEVDENNLFAESYHLTEKFETDGLAVYLAKGVDPNNRFDSAAWVIDGNSGLYIEVFDDRLAHQDQNFQILKSMLQNTER